MATKERKKPLPKADESALREQISTLRVQCQMLDIAIQRARESEQQAIENYEAVKRRIDNAYLTVATLAEWCKRRGETDKQQFYESVCHHLFNVFWTP